MHRKPPGVGRCAFIGAVTGLLTLLGDETVSLCQFGISENIGLWPVFVTLIFFGPIAIVAGAIIGTLVGAILYWIKNQVSWS